VKRFQSAVAAGSADEAETTFKAAARAIRRAATQGVIPKRRADRSVSRLAKSLNSLS
jgi:small subunit ribosomal protein S20